MFGKMLRLAMRRHENLWPQPFVKARDLFAPWMAGTMHERVAVGHDLDTLHHQPIDRGADLALVAWNGA